MSDRIDTAISDGRDQRGRFAAGNRGKPAGARARATVAAQALLDKDGKNIVRRAIELALSGDPTALRLTLERLLPPAREQPMRRVELPQVQAAADVPGAIAWITESVASGAILPSEGEKLAKMLGEMARVAELAEFDQRLRKLEESNNAR